MKLNNYYNLLKLIIYLFPFALIANSNYAATLNLTWNANIEGDLSGYKVYYGTSPGNHVPPINVGNCTSYELSGLNAGTTYYIALTAYDTFNNESEKSTEISGVAPLPPDTENPTITITSPTSSSLYSTSNNTITIAGSASDNIGVSQVTWSNNRGGSGSASGTTNWSASNISLLTGQNIITVTARDAAANTGTDSITVTYALPTTSTTSSITTSSSSSTSSSTPSTTTTTIMPSTTSSVASTTSIPATTSILVTSSVPITTSIPVTSTIPPSTTSTVHLTTTTTIPADTTPPNGTITINNSDAFTGVTQVTLKLFATDNARELNANALMTFSNDKQKWSSPEPYSTSKLWTLSPEAGVKTIYVKFRDASGNWMPKPAKDQITLFTSKKLKPTSVTASSEFLPFWLKTQAIDEKTLTLWSTAPTTSWNNEFITLDFGTTKLVEKIDMYASHLFNLDFFPVNFKIEASTNNTTWSTISTEQDYTLKSVSPDSWDFNSPAEARYLRIAITKAKTFFIFHLAQIAEIEVYGTDLPNEYPSLPETPPPPADETSPDNSTSNEVVSDNTDTQGLPGVPGKPLVNFY